MLSGGGQALCRFSTTHNVDVTKGNVCAIRQKAARAIILTLLRVIVIYNSPLETCQSEHYSGNEHLRTT